MPIFTKALPLSLYIHIPWCVRKCPYCDFNSHAIKTSLPEKAYVLALLQELEHHMPLIQKRPIKSIFFGGGTPSLFSPKSIAMILEGVGKRVSLLKPIEITLEANPGTIDQKIFKDLRAIGINRLSLGIQSLEDAKLKALGRIHDRSQALQAVAKAIQAGFSNFNLDIMYGLPGQTVQEALLDLETALSFQPNHLSWYQLTIEPNTVFHRQKPTLPHDDIIWEMQVLGQNLLRNTGFKQYEVSAYALTHQECRHNLNYWEFGDYIGIGAGAHSKLTDIKKQTVFRFSQVRQPGSYLDPQKRKTHQYHAIDEENLIFEFMMNALRLTDGFEKSLFNQRTGLSLQTVQPLLEEAKSRLLLLDNDFFIRPTPLGERFLNDLVALFLPKSRVLTYSC